MNFNLKLFVLLLLLTSPASAGMLINSYSVVPSTPASVSLNLSDSASIAPSGTTYNASNMAIGSASADRIVCVSLEISEAGVNIQSAKEDGNSMSQVSSASQDDTEGGIWCIGDSGGTTANIDVTVNTTPTSRLGMGVWRLSGTTSATFDTVSKTCNNAASCNTSALTTPTNGAAIINSAIGLDGPASWSGSGVVEQYDADIGAGRGTGAKTTTDGTPTITVNGDNSDYAISGASWDPN